MYKVDADKGFKILTAVYPNLVFINGPRFSLQAFTDKFKSTNVNLLMLDSLFTRFTSKFNMTKSAIAEYFSATMGDKPDLDNALVHELHAYMDRFRTSPCVISGSVGNIVLIQRIFDEDHAIFTYVYIYPNSSEKYRELVLAASNSCDLTDTNDPLVVAIMKDKSVVEDVKVKAKKSSKTKSAKLSVDVTIKKEETAVDLYIKYLLDSRKKIFKTHTDTLGRALVILA